MWGVVFCLGNVLVVAGVFDMCVKEERVFIKGVRES